MDLLKNNIGKRLDKIVRLDNEPEDYGHFYPLGIHLIFADQPIGLSLTTDNVGQGIIWRNETYEDFISNKLEGFGFINELRRDDSLVYLLNQELKGIKIVMTDKNKLIGNNFTIVRGDIQGILFSFVNQEMIVKNSGDELYIDVDSKIEIDEKEFLNVEST
jgi:hypothetical protein